MCKKSWKCIDHLLIHCETAYALWSSIFDLYRFKWVMPRRIVDLFALWRGQWGSSQKVALWKMILSCLMWYIWREINDQRSVVDLKTFFKTLYQWTTAYVCLHISRYYYFLDLSSFSDYVFLLYTWVVLSRFNKILITYKRKRKKDYGISLQED